MVKRISILMIKLCIKSKIINLSLPAYFKKENLRGEI